MPRLNKINCSIELGPGNVKLPEYGARYSDGHVEAFVAVPDSHIPFSVHLKSDGYIAPGLAIFVFMDGEYQCNRNRVGLKIPGDGVHPQDYETEFRVRQKEERSSSGTFVARDWTFAKLDRVKADKAPNLNPLFTSNVGTIEVVVLRCHTDLDDVPPPKASRGQVQAPEPRARSVTKRSSKSAAPKKAATPQQSDFGGLMFGLFDGAGDDFNFGVPVDAKPVGPDGKVRVEPPPSMKFDSTVGKWVLASHRYPHLKFGSGLNLHDHVWAAQSRDQAAAKANGVRLGGLDGHPGGPGFVNQWADRGRDDTRGDKYFGVEEYGPRGYMQYLRNTGQPLNAIPAGAAGGYVNDVPEWAKRNPQQNNPPHGPHARVNYREVSMAPQHAYPLPPRFPHAQANIQSGFQQPPQPDPGLIAFELESTSKQIHAYMQQNPMGDLSKAKRDLATVTGLQFLQRQGHGSLAHFPLWLLEGLIDIELRRQYVLGLVKRQAGFDYSRAVQDIRKEHAKILTDLLYHKTFRIDAADDVMTFIYMLRERIDKLKSFVERTVVSPDATANGIRERLDFLRLQKSNAEATYARLQARDDERRRQGLVVDDADRLSRPVHRGADDPSHNTCPQFLDGWQNVAPEGNLVGWENVGSGTRKPGPDEGNVQQKTGWSSVGKQPSQKSNEKRSAWGWKAAESHKTTEHNFSDAKGQTGWQQNESQKDHSSRRSESKKGWNDNKDDGQKTESNQGWGSGNDANNVGDNGWGGDAQQKSAAHSVRSGVKAQNEDAQAKIKPYWKDWTRPFNRLDSSDANTKKRDEPRDVYNYPAATLPAVPAEKAKHASHGIQTGKGADYSHKCRKPVYIDTMEHPYAVFSFKYRSKHVLEKILKYKIDDVDIKKIEEQIEEDRLKAMPKHKLVEELMEKRAPPKNAKSVSKDIVGKEGGNAGSGWAEQAGGGGGDNNGWGSGSNGNAGWAGQSSKSSHSRTGSKRSDGWDKQSQNDKKSSKKGWNNSPANNGGWDGSSEARVAYWLAGMGVPVASETVVTVNGTVAAVDETVDEVEYEEVDGILMPVGWDINPDYESGYASESSGPGFLEEFDNGYMNESDGVSASSE